MVTITLLVVLVVLMALRIPISICIGIAALISLIMADIPLDVMPRLMTDSLDSFALLAVPFFVLAGNLMNASGITQRIFDFARALLGWMRGSLGHVNVGASMIFAGMSGSALADLAGLGALEIKAMRENGYPVDFSAAVSIASCTIGPIIPPSIMLVIYGLATDTSVGRLFLGGIIPGVIIGTLCMIFISMWVRWKRVSWGQPDPFDAGNLWRTFKAGALALVAPIIIIGSLIGGVTTPSELGAIAAGYAFLVGLVYGELNWKTLHRCLIDSVSNTAVVMYLIAVSQV
ncbi:MAG: TRAP transporter large permease, partial [Rhodospirillales bacterium]|nr:TRAP transporter large permease [Rhodospirillales bacterium]